MASRTYTTIQGVLAFGNGVPEGANSYVEALGTAGDGKWVKCSNMASAAVELFIVLTYDGAIPPNATINSVQIVTTYAKNYAASDPELVGVLSNTVAWDGYQALPDPGTLCSGATPPTSANFLTTTKTFTDGAPVPATFQDGINYDVTCQPISAKSALAYVDNTYAIINFSLDELGPGVPVAFDIEPNNFKVSTTFSAEEGSLNATYPVTVYFQYTEQDPDAEDASDITLGQGQIKSTTTTTITGAGIARIEAQVPNPFNPLNPNKSLVANHPYWVRTVAANADNTGYSQWVEVTTTQFDPISGF